MIEILFWIFFGLVIAIIIGSFVVMLNPNLQGKMLSSQVKSLKYMMDDSKDTLKNLTSAYWFLFFLCMKLIFLNILYFIPKNS